MKKKKAVTPDPRIRIPLADTDGGASTARRAPLPPGIYQILQSPPHYINARALTNLLAGFPATAALQENSTSGKSNLVSTLQLRAISGAVKSSLTATQQF